MRATNDGGDVSRLLVTIRPTAEVTIKAPRTRDTFLRKLRLAVKDALQRAGFEARVRARANRVMAEITPKADGDQGVEEARAALGRVFGVGSFSFLEATSRPELDEIVATGTELFAERVKGRRYAVRCKRAGRHPFSSMDVERKLGAALNPGATVDLTNPEITVEVEVGERQALFFSERDPGPGGLPMGTGGHALALLSGGYDSVVAAWQLMRRGVEVDFVHFRLGDIVSERTALDVAKLVSDGWGAGSRPEAHVIDLRGAMDEMRGSVTPNLWQVSLKRLMVRAADGVADAMEAHAAAEAPADEKGPRERGRRRARRRVDALVTGEAVGQVSSQTLSNLRTIDDAAQRPVLRPLIGFDKLDIIALAERIGTAELSAKSIEECNITPVRPATSSRAERLAREEEGMAAGALEAELERVARGGTRLPLRSRRMGEGLLELRNAVAELDAGALYTAARDGAARDAASEFGEVMVTEVPDGAVLLDCRSEAMRRWQPEWERVTPVPLGVVNPADYADDAVYVAFCPQGQRSAAVAEKLREGGVRAYSFAGGEGALKKYLDGR